MENNVEEVKTEKNENGGIIIGIVSFFSAIISLFVMFWIFSIITLTTGFAGLRNERSRGLCITALLIDIIAIVLMFIRTMISSDLLTDAFLKGFI